jgi:predicted ribosome quality control (RQC) complex YloA/Tae2 family protein
MDEPLHYLRKQIRKALSHAQERAAHALSACEEALSPAAYAEAERWKECGELLKVNLPLIHKGMPSVSLPDFFSAEEDAVREIALDPMLKPLDNAKRYFKRYRKRLDAKPHMERERTKAERELALISALKEEFDTWQDTAAPTDAPPPEWGPKLAEARIYIPGLPAQVTEAPETKEDTPVISQADAEKVKVARKFTSYDGLTIWVGKSDADNDRLSLRLAHGNDWWLHIAHQSGSHVLVTGMERLKTSDGRTLAKDSSLPDKGKKKTDSFLPQETLLDACHLAIYYSKARQAAKAEVDVTQAKFVRKPRGVHAGTVTLGQYRSVTVRIEPDRLERLLRP